MDAKDGGWRWTVPPRVWDRKKGEWVYFGRHKKKVVDEDLYKAYKKGEFRIHKRAKGVSWADALVGGSSDNVLSEMGVKRLSIYPDGAPKGYLERRGRPPGSYPLRVRLCISKILRSPMEWEEVRANMISIDSVINCMDDNYSRGPLFKKTVIMPDFSLALRELLLRSGGNREKVVMEGLLASYCRGDVKVSPESVIRLFPERGPGSGEARSLISGLLEMKFEDLGEDHVEDLQKSMNKIWRGFLTRLIELYLEREERLKLEDFPKEYHDGRVIIMATGTCPECGDDRPIAVDEGNGETWCRDCEHIFDAKWLEYYSGDSDDCSD